MRVGSLSCRYSTSSTGTLSLGKSWQHSRFKLSSFYVYNIAFIVSGGITSYLIQVIRDNMRSSSILSVCTGNVSMSVPCLEVTDGITLMHLILSALT